MKKMNGLNDEFEALIMLVEEFEFVTSYSL